MSNDLGDIERVAGNVLRQLSSAQRRALMRRLARERAQSQRSRIAAQREPDGSPFTPRAEPKPPAKSRYPVSFLYPSGGAGPARKVTMTSYDMQNGMMTGYDIETRAIRSFAFDKVIKWLPVPPDQRGATGGRLRRRNRLRRKAMFRRLATARYLRSETDELGFYIGFTGRAAELARIHHLGLRDRPSLKARAVDYPKRELVGWSDADREAMLDDIYDFLAEVIV